MFYNYIQVTAKHPILKKNHYLVIFEQPKRLLNKTYHCLTIHMKKCSVCCTFNPFLKLRFYFLTRVARNDSFIKHKQNIKALFCNIGKKHQYIATIFPWIRKQSSLLHDKTYLTRRGNSFIHMYKRFFEEV